MMSSKFAQINMQTGGKNKQESGVNNNNTKVVGVSLVSDVANTASTSLGVCLVSDVELNSWNVAELRQAIIRNIIACPPNFQICTKQGWPLTEVQEEQLSVQQILNEKQEVLIKVKHDKPKCGIKDRHGHVIGFVHISYTDVLAKLRNLILSQVLNPEDISKNFQFLDGNSWPISYVQEHHMTVADILIGYCVSTNLHSKHSITFSPTKEPPLKKLKGVGELSFRSGKDVYRRLDSRVSDNGGKSKQVLISYVRSEAADHALQLKQQLLDLGLSVYLDVHEIQTGVDWQDSLNFAVSGCEVFVPLVTLKYGETQWTNREVKLADVLGKYILPVSFLSDWPPRCLAIQFATTQFIPWVPPTDIPATATTQNEKFEWSLHHIQLVAHKIADRLKGLSLQSIPSLMKRTTIVKSCACVTEDNMLAITSDRDGKPLVMICVHHSQETYGGELQSLLEEEGFEVWCTTKLDREHIDHIDGLASSQDEITYSILNKGTDNKVFGFHSNSIIRNIEIFQEKADDASLVLFILSDAFASSRVCQQQVFYCEHRKHVVPILYEEFKMPEWMSMLVGSHGFQMRKDEDFVEILVRRIKATIGSARSQQSLSSLVSLRTLPNPNSLTPTGTRTASLHVSASGAGTRTSVERNRSDDVNSSRSNGDSENGGTVSKANSHVNGSYSREESANEGSESEKMDINTGPAEDKPSLSSMKTVIL